MVNQIKARISKSVEYRKPDADLNHLSWAQAWAHAGLHVWVRDFELKFFCQLRGANYKEAILQDMDDAAATLRSLEKEMGDCINSKEASEEGSGYN